MSSRAREQIELRRARPVVLTLQKSDLYVHREVDIEPGTIHQKM